MVRMSGRVRMAWALAWAAALFAMYTTMVGHGSFLPLYFAEGYLSLVAGFLIVYRLATMYPEGEVSFGAHVVMLVCRCRRGGIESFCADDR